MEMESATETRRWTGTLDNGSIFMRFACFDKHSSGAVVFCVVRCRVASCQTTPRTSRGITNPKSNSIGNPKAAGNNLKITFVQRGQHFYEGRVRFEFDRAR